MQNVPMKRVGRRVAMSSTSFLTSPWKYPILAPTDRNISSVDLRSRAEMWSQPNVQEIHQDTYFIAL